MRKDRQKTGRNEACPCGSDRKYKQCCLRRIKPVPIPRPAAERISLADALKIAVAHHQAGRLQQAESIYRQILEVDAEHADALHLSGVIAQQRGELDSAEKSISKAISINATVADYHNNLGIVLRKQGKLDAAARSYQQAISLKPEFTEAHNNLGVVFKHQNKLEAAIECYHKALAITPEYIDAHINAGSLSRDLGKPDIAIEHLQLAIAIKPDSAEAYNSLGLVLREKGELNESVSCYHKALSIQPNYADAYNGLGSALMEQGKQRQALITYEKGLTFDSSNALLHHSLIFAASRDCAGDSAKVFALSTRFGKQLESGIIHEPHDNDATPGKRLRIGYVSGDLRRHSVAYFIGPVLEHHDKQQVEIFCYYNYHTADHITHKLMALTDHWRPIFNMPDEEAAGLIRQDAIDILVDLSGHTAYNRLPLFARKPAPVQVTWIGYPATTGLSAMDYRLTNAYMDPPGWNEVYHTETLVRLSTSTCFQPIQPLPEIEPLPALKNGYITFASFHTPGKITPTTIALWAQILAAIPDAKLLQCPDTAKERMIRQFQALGIAADRVEFLPSQPLPQYLALHNQVDIMLDTFPYNGGTISRHALWMGVPVLTMAGKSAVSRVGLALMTQLGLASFVAENTQDLVNNACRWAGNLERLAQVRAGLREKMQQAPFSRFTLFVRELETAYRQMWHRWCEQK